MSRSARRLAAIAATAVAATTLLVPLTAVPALAVTATETEFFLADSNGDYSYELWKRTAPTGTATKVAGDATHTYADLSVSTDGSRIAYRQTTLNSVGNPVSDQLIVRDVSGNLVRIVSSVAASLTSGSSQPVLSPDGNTLVWSNGGPDSTPSLYRAGVGSGAPTLVKSGYFSPVFVDSSTLLAQSNATGAWATIPLAGGTATTVSGVPDTASSLAVSPDGTQLAWSADTTASASFTSDLKVASLAVASGVATIGAPQTVATGQDNIEPTFSRDGNTVYFVKWDGNMGAGEIWAAPSSGASSSALSVASASDELDVVIGTTDDGTLPGAVTAKPAVLNGTGATVGWTLPTDTDRSGVRITRRLGSTVQKAVYVPAPVTSYADSGLVLGTTYTYSFQAVDRSGNLGATAMRSLTALKPAPVVADPTSTTSTKAAFPVTFAATAPSNATFNVDYLVAGATTWTPWVTNTAGRLRTFGTAATTGVAATTSTAGTSYSFRVQVKDAFGNASGWVSSSRAVVPFDQSKATLSGGTTLSNASAYLGSYRKLSSTSSYAKVTLTGNRLQVVGLKCSSCGAFAIYDGSTLVATVDTYASTTKYRQVLYTRSYSTLGTHTFTIRPKGTSGRPAVMLDGFAMRR